MEKGKAKEQPNHVIKTNETNTMIDATRRREKRKNNPTSKIVTTKGYKRRNKGKGKAEEQPNLEDQQTKRYQRTENKPATAWETLVDCR